MIINPTISSPRLVKLLSRRIALGLLMASLPVTVSAQARRFPDFTLEELMRIDVEPVFGASKRLQPVTEAPASVTIVTRDEIARYGYRSLADVLRGVRGFFVTSDRNYSYLGARGFARPGDYSTRILLLVDGHRMNDNVYEQAALGREFGVDAAMFERVEIVRGPSSSLYGTSAFFAVVNVIMRKGADLNGFTASGDAGSFRSGNAHVAFGTVARGVDVALSASYSRSDGPARLYFPAFDAPETNGGVAEHLDDEEAVQLFGRLRFPNFTLSGAYGNRTKGVPTASYDTVFNDPSLRTGDAHGFIDAEYGRALRGTQIVLRAYADRYRYDGAYPYESGEDGLVSVFRDYGIGTWAGSEARVTRTLRGSHSITAGTEFRRNFRQAQGGADEGAPDDAFAVDRSSNAGAIYLQDEITLHRAVRASVGVRYDVYGDFSRLTPRAALIFTPSTRQAFKYLYGTAFRAPNAYELDYFSEGVRDENLRPETISSHEVVWERYIGTWLRTSTSAYRNNVSRLLTLQGGASGIDDLTWTNHGNVRAAGIEFEGEGRFKRVEALGSYTFQRTRDLENGVGLTNSPHHAAKLRFSTPGPVSGSTVAFETQYLGPRTTLGGNVARSARTANLTFVEPIGARLDVVGAIRNMFGARYGDPGSEEHRQDVIEQDGRTFSIGLRWRFRMP
jgi:iron complex outermembrane receptor protein